MDDQASKRIRVGVVGLGGIAQKAHLPVLAAMEEIEIAGLVGRRREVVEAIADRYRLAGRFTSLRDLLEAGVQAAFVLTSTDSHAEVAISLLEAGVDVFLEKPLAYSLEEASAIVETARRHGRVLMVGFNRRFAPFYLAAREEFLAAPPALIQVEKSRRHPGSALHEALIDDAIHIIDLARWIGGEVSEVFALAAGTAGSSTGAEGAMLPGVSALLRFASGAVGQVTLSHAAGGWIERLQVHGSGRTVLVEGMEILRRREGGRETIETFDSWTPVLERRGFLGAARHFTDCVRRRQTPIASGEESLESQRLAQRIYEACLAHQKPGQA